MRNLWRPMRNFWRRFLLDVNTASLLLWGPIAWRVRYLIRGLRFLRYELEVRTQEMREPFRKALRHAWFLWCWNRGRYREWAELEHTQQVAVRLAWYGDAQELDPEELAEAISENRLPR